jgi:glutathione S-transferase
MKLLYSPASPYVRKCVVLAHETGILDRIELVGATAVPVKINEEIERRNPLAKLPTLILDDGSSLFDSPVIAEYLDSQHGGRKFFPPAGPARWVALRRQAMADGVLDAALLCRYELTTRPAEYRWSAWIDGQMRKIHTTLAALATDVAGFAAEPSIGEIAVGCMLGYLDFRFPDEAWRSEHPALAAWFDRFSDRPSMVATKPVG